MGSRPPRQHALPKTRPAHREPRAAPARQPDDRGLKMETLAVFIGLAIFPVALGASAVAYLVNQDSRDIATAAVLTVVVGAVTALIARSRTAWRRDARMSNELLMALLVGLIGATFLIGGLASLSVAWSAAGLVVLAGAVLIARTAKPTAR